MFLPSVYTLLGQVLLQLLIWFWRSLVEIQQGITRILTNINDNKFLFGAAILLTTSGVALKLGQAEVMEVMDQFYECFVFILDQILWIFMTALRNTQKWIATRYNDILGYLRGILSDIRTALQVLLEEDEDGIIFGKGTNNIAMISDLYDIARDVILTWQQWSISVPSIEIRFFTVSWTVFLNWWTCQQAWAYNVISGILRGTVFSESRHFCIFQLQQTTECPLTNTATPGIEIGCTPGGGCSQSRCHNYLCQQITCQIDLISNITVLILGASEGLTATFNRAKDAFCCLYDLLDRAIWLVVGAITSCIDNYGTEIQNYGIEWLGCLDNVIEFITDGQVENAFMWFFGQIWLIIGTVVTGVEGMVECMEADYIENCFESFDFIMDSCASGWVCNLDDFFGTPRPCPDLVCDGRPCKNFTCWNRDIQSQSEALFGFSNCFCQLDWCMLQYPLWQPLGGTGFLRIWEDFLNVINRYILCYPTCILQAMFSECPNVGDCDAVADCDPLDCLPQLAECMHGYFNCLFNVFDPSEHCAVFATPCSPCPLPRPPGCPSCSPHANLLFQGSRLLSKGLTIWHTLKRKFDIPLHASDKRQELLLNLDLCVERGLSLYEENGSECVFGCTTDTSACLEKSFFFSNGFTFKNQLEWELFLAKVFEDKVITFYSDSNCTKNYLLDENNSHSIEYFQCLSKVLGSFKSSLYLPEFLQEANRYIDSGMVPEELESDLQEQLEDRVTSAVRSIPKVFDHLVKAAQSTRYYTLYKEFADDFLKIKQNEYSTALSNSIFYDRNFIERLKETEAAARYINFTDQVMNLYFSERPWLKRQTVSDETSLSTHVKSPIEKLENMKRRKQYVEEAVFDMYNTVKSVATSDKLSKYVRVASFINTKLVKYFEIDKTQAYQFAHATHAAISQGSISNLTKWIQGDLFYIPEQGFVNKTEYDAFIGDFNPLNPWVYQPTINLSFRNQTVPLGIFLTGVVFENFTFNWIGEDDSSTVPPQLMKIFNKIEKRLLYDYSKSRTFSQTSDPSEFNFDTWFTVDFIGGLVNWLIGASKTFYYDFIVQGINFLKELDWSEDVLNPIEVWFGNVSNCIWPEQINGSGLYNPFCLPLLYEGMFRFVEPLPNAVMPTQIGWPDELIDPDGDCKNTYLGNSNFIFTFVLSDNCEAQTQNFGRSVAFAGNQGVNRVAIVGSPQDGFIGSRSGLIYVYRETVTQTWELIQQLEANDTTQFERTGFSMDSLDMGIFYRVVIGSPGANKRIGEIRVYNQNSDGTLESFQNLTLPNIPFVGYGSYLGVSTSISGFRIAGGVPSFNNQRGAVFVWSTTGIVGIPYTLSQVLEVPADPAFPLLRDNIQFFGTSVSLYGPAGRLYGGAPNYPLIPFIGDTDTLEVNMGTVLIFSFNGIEFEFLTRVLPTKTTFLETLTNARFGATVTSSSNWLVVGAPGYANGRGRVYIYSTSDFVTPDAVFTGATAGDAFGSCVDLYQEGLLVVGIPGASTALIYSYSGGWAPFYDPPGGLGHAAGSSCFLNGDIFIAGGPDFSASTGAAKIHGTTTAVTDVTLLPTTESANRPSCPCDYCKREYIRGEIEPVVFGFSQSLQPCEVLGFMDALDSILFAVAYLVKLLNTVIFGGVSFQFISDFGLFPLIIITIAYGGFNYLVVVIPTFYISIWFLHGAFGEFLPTPLVIIGLLIIAVAFGFLSVSVTSNAVPLLIGFALLVTWIVFMIAGWGVITTNFTQVLFDTVNTLESNPLTSWIPGLEILQYRTPKWIYPNNEIPEADKFCFFFNFGEMALAFLAAFGVYHAANILLSLTYVTLLALMAIATALMAFLRDIVVFYRASDPTASFVSQQKLQNDFAQFKSEVKNFSFFKKKNSP